MVGVFYVEERLIIGVKLYNFLYVVTKIAFVK